MNAAAKELRENRDACPYCDAKSDVCEASVTSLKIGALARINRCSSENYDTCSLFLAKCLRRDWQYRYAS
jgi:hypothetical protein